jgi:hypothetical protein
LWEWGHSSLLQGPSLLNKLCKSTEQSPQKNQGKDGETGTKPEKSTQKPTKIEPFSGSFGGRNVGFQLLKSEAVCINT